MAASPRSSSSGRMLRLLHPGAWWVWALGMTVAASRTTNPLVLCLLLAVVAHVVSARRSDAPWARGLRAYYVLGLVVIGIRVLFRMVLDGQHGDTVLFHLPEIPLPEAAAGIRLGGAVTLEGLLAALYDGLRLAALLICIGAVNVLADPKRLLKAMPSALHELGVAITVGLTFAPQMVESAQRIRRARRLRGEVGRRGHLLRQVALPVLTDALDRSLLLAAAMDGRGYGRRAAVPRHLRVVTAALLLGALMGLSVGTYAILDLTAPRLLALPMVVLGVVAACAGLALGGRRVQRSRYRPDPWIGAEWAVAACGVGVAVIMVVASSVDPGAFNTPAQPLTWPTLPLGALAAAAVGLLPAWLAPPARRPSRVASGPMAPGPLDGARVSVEDSELAA